LAHGTIAGTQAGGEGAVAANRAVTTEPIALSALGPTALAIEPVEEGTNAAYDWEGGADI